MKHRRKPVVGKNGFSKKNKKIGEKQYEEALELVTDLTISKNHLLELDNNFKKSDKLNMARNTIISVGPEYCNIDSERLSEITHIFLNSIKRKDLKATNQEYSGRCWMFAGLNIFRHSIIKALDLDNFEFSETYLYFYDKLERCNTFLQHFLDNPEAIHASTNDRLTEFFLKNFMGDGGWWNCFSNLVNKYGVVPKNAMPETYTSGYSDLMNNTLQDILISTIVEMDKTKTITEKYKIKNAAVDRIYNVLVMCLGHPPRKFTWYYTSQDGESTAHSDITPQQFTKLFFDSIDIDDFIVLGNIPSDKYKYYQKYQVKNTNNIIEGKSLTFINLPIEELKKHTVKSLKKGLPVWFSGDVSKGMSHMHMSLDEKLVDRSLFFGKNYEMTKGQKIDLAYLGGIHAMAFTGFNESEKGDVINFQVENSWGYYDNEIPGLDGFWCATSDWFDQNVTDVCIHKNLLSRKVSKCINQKPIFVEPWDNCAPALMSK